VTEKPPADCSILIVEDDVSIRRLVQTVLEREGYRVELANDGAEAVRKMAVADYGVIILDLMMPNLDGFSFLGKMARESPERLKRVIITSAASAAVIEERLKGIPFELLPKPFDIADLKARVRACLDAE
jgi:DNA-binding response OmpR family regulator